jgi:hypothetical protein
LQVFGVVGHDDERADVAAGRAPGETGGSSERPMASVFSLR